MRSSTEDKYASVIKEASNAGYDGERILDWLNNKINSQTPTGTILPMRAAVRHYLESLGFDPGDIHVALPATTGLASAPRRALTPEQLAAFYAALETEVPNPAYTLLAILPHTGLSIKEACKLKTQFVGRHTLFVSGNRGKDREVPLNKVARKFLDAYEMDGKWLFPNPLGSAISPAAIRKYTRRIAALYPEFLADLTPHTLRHTAALMWLAEGKELTDVQKYLGHKSIQTTALYLNQED